MAAVEEKVKTTTPVEEPEQASAGASEPPAKKAKNEEPEEPKELELDEEEDKRPKTKIVSKLNAFDSTLDSIVAGGVLSGLSSDIFAACKKAVRGTAGIKAGRYYFEVKALEFGIGPQALKTLAVGVSTSSTSLVPKDGETFAMFNSDSHYYTGEKRQPLHIKEREARGFHAGDVLGVLLNTTDAGNAKSISLFKNGKRCGDAMPLPETTEAWFPHVMLRCANVAVNFGPQQQAPTPFKVRMWCDAANPDAVQSPVAEPKQKSKPQAVVAVGVPNNGLYNWVDEFLSKNPDFMEVSNRAAARYVDQSGTRLNSIGGTEDRPACSGHGIDLKQVGLQNPRVREQLLQAAVVRRRNVVIVGVIDNLKASERGRLLAILGGQYSVSATVVAGEPPADFKKKAQDAVRSAKAAAHERAVEIVKKRNESARTQKLVRMKADRARKLQAIQTRRKAAAKLRELKKQKDEAKAKKEEADAAKKEGEAKDDEKKEEEEKKEEAAAPAEEEKVEDELNEDIDPETLVPEVDESAISDGEAEPEFKDETDYSKVWFVPTKHPEFPAEALASSFTEFALPTKEEGFEKVDFAWKGNKDAQAALTKLVFDCKKMQPIHVQHSEWFKDQMVAWKVAFGKWKDVHEEAARKEQDRLRQKKEAGEDVEEDDEVEIWGVEDILDAAGGMPLFKNFRHEDWVMLQLRFELHCMVHAFSKATEDHPGIHPDLLNHYSMQFFQRPLQVMFYGQKDMAEFLITLADTITVNEDTGCVEAGHPDETPIDTFVKLTEEARRERAARIEAGDETAKLVIGDRRSSIKGKGGKGKGQRFDAPFQKGFVAAKGFQKGAVRPVVPPQGFRAQPYGLQGGAPWAKGFGKGVGGRGKGW